MILEAKTTAQPKRCARAHCRDEHPVVGAPFVWPPPPHVLYKPLQDVAVEFRIYLLTWRDEFLMDGPYSIDKEQH